MLPISEHQHAYAKEVADKLTAAGFRLELDDRNEKIGYKIREAQLEKVPFMLILGDKEVESGGVAVRSRSEGDLGTMSLDDLITKLSQMVKDRVKE